MLKKKHIFLYLICGIVSLGLDPLSSQELQELEGLNESKGAVQEIKEIKELNGNKKTADVDLQDFILKIEKYKDPFVPLLGKAYNQKSIRGKMRLGGILWSPVNPLVVINGKILAPGDGIEGAIVTFIEKDRVFLRYNNKIFSLVFWEMEGAKGGKKK